MSGDTSAPLLARVPRTAARYSVSNRPCLGRASSPFSAPHRHPFPDALSFPQERGTGPQEQVLPQQGVGEDLLVGAEQREDAAGGDQDRLPLGPALGTTVAELLAEVEEAAD